MDPVTVSTTCVGLLAAVAQLSVQISVFVSGVREAHRDMDAVSRELVSLKLCLEALRDDWGKIQYPYDFEQNLLAVMQNCNNVAEQMSEMLQKMASNSLGRRVQWTTFGRDDMNKLRSSLETHKSALDIALDLTSLLIISTVKEDTEAIKADTSAIKNDVSQIPLIKQDTAQIGVLVEEIASLRLQVTILEQRHDRGGEAVVLHRFLNDTSTYAETVLEDDLSDDEDNVSGTSDLASRVVSYDVKPLSIESTASQHTQSEINRTDLSEARRVLVSEEQNNSHNSDVRSLADSARGIREQGKPNSGASEGKSNPLPGFAYPHRPIDPPHGMASLNGNSIATLLSLASSSGIRAMNPDTGAIAQPQSATSLPASSSSQSDEQIRHPQETRKALLAHPKRSPDLARCEAATRSRSTLSSSERKALDKRFAHLIRGRKSNLNRLVDGDHWIGKRVGTFSDVKEALEAGAEMHFGQVSAFEVEMEHHQRKKVMELLLSYGILLHTPEEHLPRHLVSAVTAASETPALQLLLDYGLNPELEVDDRTALDYAISNRSEDCVETLFANGADANHRSGTARKTPLNIACERGDMKIVKTLLNHATEVVSQKGGSDSRWLFTYLAYLTDDRRDGENTSHYQERMELHGLLMAHIAKRVQA